MSDKKIVVLTGERDFIDIQDGVPVTNEEFSESTDVLTLDQDYLNPCVAYYNSKDRKFYPSYYKTKDCKFEVENVKYWKPMRLILPQNKK